MSLIMSESTQAKLRNKDISHMKNHMNNKTFQRDKFFEKTVKARTVSNFNRTSHLYVIKRS